MVNIMACNAAIHKTTTRSHIVWLTSAGISWLTAISTPSVTHATLSHFLAAWYLWYSCPSFVLKSASTIPSSKIIAADTQLMMVYSVVDILFVFFNRHKNKDLFWNSKVFESKCSPKRGDSLFCVLLV